MKYMMYAFLFVCFITNSIFADGPTIANSLEDAMMEAEMTKQKIVAVFSAGWCGPCNQLKKDLANNLSILDECIYVRIDIDARKDLKQSYGVRTIPDIRIIENGFQIKRKVGYNNIKELEKWLKN